MDQREKWGRVKYLLLQYFMGVDRVNSFVRPGKRFVILKKEVV